MRLAILTLAIALGATAAPALAKQNCPPGLAKKAVPCVPPGLAKKGVRAYDHDRDAREYERERERRYYDYIGEYDGYRRDDRYRYEYDRVRDYDRYRLPRLDPGEGYYRDGRVVLRVDDQTRRIIEIIRLADLEFN